MKPLYVLIGSFIISLILLNIVLTRIDYALAGRIAMACMLLFTAMGHFAFTKGMASMIPNFFPFKMEIVIATGILEIAFAICLIFPGTRLITGWILIAFFILILPANIKASLENINYQTGELNGPGLLYLWFRIPLQLLFIVWVYFSAIRG